MVTVVQVAAAAVLVAMVLVCVRVGVGVFARVGETGRRSPCSASCGEGVVVVVRMCTAGGAGASCFSHRPAVWTVCDARACSMYKRQSLRRGRRTET